MKPLRCAPRASSVNRRTVIFASAAVVLLAIGVFAAHHLAFDWRSLRVQLRSVSVLRVLIGVACIYGTFFLRAVRWAVLLGPRKKVSAATLIAPQFIGFTAVTLFGRLADLGRPYLIARRTNLPVAAQVAIYSVERMFDLAAAAIIFSVTLALAPRDLPHHEMFARAGAISLAATLFVACAAVAIRVAGERIALLAERLLRPMSVKMASSAAGRIRDFRTGLDTLSSLRTFVLSLGISLVMWFCIAESYVQSVHAMTATPELATLSFTQTMLLMATSMGGSLLQVPILGWFTQIGIMALAVHNYFGVPSEPATAYGAVLLFINNLSFVPAGLLVARSTGISLSSTTEAAEAQA